MKKYLRSVFFAAVIGVVVLCGCAAPSEPDLLTAPVVFTFQRSKPYTYDVLGTVTNKTNKSIQHITVQIAMSK